MSAKVKMLKTLNSKKCLDDIKTLKNKKQFASMWFRELRDKICKSFEEIENSINQGDKISPLIRKGIIEACIKCDIDYLAIGILDIGIKSKVDNNQNREISVSVQSQVWNIQEKLPRVIAAVGPITSDANEKDDITTIKKALVDPADSVARNIVDQLNAKNIN